MGFWCPLSVLAMRQKKKRRKKFTAINKFITDYQWLFLPPLQVHERGRKDGYNTASVSWVMDDPIPVTSQGKLKKCLVNKILLVLKKNIGHRRIVK